MNEPRTLTDAIAKIRDRLALLTWTDIVQGRAHVHDIKLAGQDKAQLKPQVYIGNGEYLDCRPNDKYKSVLFFATTEKEKTDFNRMPPTSHAPNHINRATRNLTLYGWVNLSRTPAFDDGSGFVELIKLDLKKALQDVHCIMSTSNFLDGQTSEVFKPFVVSDLDTKYDRWPFACFRLELSILTVETRLPQ